MQTVTFSERDLPFEELKKIGLADSQGLLMDRKDIHALLSGSRTSLLKLKDFDHDGMEIKEINVKLSLSNSASGQKQLVYHPVYKQSQRPSFISANEGDDLITGLKANMLKEIEQNGVKKETLIEYDHDTREFVMTDLSRLKVPAEINGISLTPYQKERYSKGREIELSDGTTFQASSTSPDGIRSNRLALVVSILMDGGISYMLLTGLKALIGERGTLAQSNEKSAEFKAASNSYEKQQAKEIPAELSSEKAGNKQEQSRGYGRSGFSR